MFFLTKPTRSEIDAFLERNAASSLTYTEVGATLEPTSPAGYWHTDLNRVLIGKGEKDWERAKQMVREWKMFDLGWAGICWPDTPIEEGRTVAMIASHLGHYSLNAARIVYTLDEDNRFGFAYGTLDDHAECGEELFSVRLDPRTGDVVYHLYSFSRPQHYLTFLGYPYARYLQKRFVADSQRAMLRGMRG